MEKIWVAIGAIFIVLAIIVTESISTLRLSNGVINDVAEISSSVEEKDYESAREILQRAENNWSTTKKVLSLSIPHQRIDNIEPYFIILKPLLDEEDEEELLIECHRIEMLIYHTRDTERPIIENIL